MDNLLNRIANIYSFYPSTSIRSQAPAAPILRYPEYIK